MQKTTLSLLFISLIIFSCDRDSTTNAPNDTVFFKVGEIDFVRGDSFILALNNPQDIAHARALIANPEGSPDRLILARIIRQRGDETYLNKNPNTDQTWSWRIDTFQGFVFNTIEILDGWPGYIEEDVDRWFQNTSDDPDSGVIGFWNYTVVEEINIPN